MRADIIDRLERFLEKAPAMHHELDAERALVKYLEKGIGSQPLSGVKTIG